MKKKITWCGRTTSNSWRPSIPSSTVVDETFCRHRKYNYRVVENAFGRLKGRWFEGKMEMFTEENGLGEWTGHVCDVCDVVASCIVLLVSFYIISVKCMVIIA